MHLTGLSSNSGNSDVSQRERERERVRTHLGSVDICQIFACIEGKKMKQSHVINLLLFLMKFGQDYIIDQY